MDYVQGSARVYLPSGFNLDSHYADNGATMIKSNQHRIGKHPFQAYLTDAEKKIVDKAKAKAKAGSSRELIVGLSQDFLAKP